MQILLTRARWTASRTCPVSKASRTTPRAPASSVVSAHHSPPMWNEGMLKRLTSAADHPIHSSPAARIDATTAKKLLCASWTPLGSPVVPLVYIWTTTSSGDPSRHGSGPADASRHAT